MTRSMLHHGAHILGGVAFWHPQSKTRFAGDLVEAETAIYTGDAEIRSKQVAQSLPGGVGYTAGKHEGKSP